MALFSSSSFSKHSFSQSHDIPLLLYFYYLSFLWFLVPFSLFSCISMVIPGINNYHLKDYLSHLTSTDPKQIVSIHLFSFHVLSSGLEHVLNLFVQPLSSYTNKASYNKSRTKGINGLSQVAFETVKKIAEWEKCIIKIHIINVPLWQCFSSWLVRAL